MSSFLVHDAPFVYQTAFDKKLMPELWLLTVQIKIGQAMYTTSVLCRRTGINLKMHCPILMHIPHVLRNHITTVAFDVGYTLKLSKEALVIPPSPDYFLLELTPCRSFFFDGIPHGIIHGEESLLPHSIIVSPQAFLGFARVEERYSYKDQPNDFILYCAVYRPDGALFEHIHIRIDKCRVDSDPAWDDITS
ncbi:hypothetical protein FISHEDRAFT_74742, partial [Fistulina hepatica ATCC 64428]